MPTWSTGMECQAALARLHERRVPDHVGEHHRDEPTIEPLSHDSSLVPPGDGRIGIVMTLSRSLDTWGAATETFAGHAGAAVFRDARRHLAQTRGPKPRTRRSIPAGALGYANQNGPALDPLEPRRIKSFLQ